MAVADFKRIDITAHSSVKTKVISYLQKAGCVEIIKKHEDPDSLEYGETGLETRIQENQSIIQDIEQAITVLESYIPREPFFERITKEPEGITEEDFRAYIDDREHIYSCIDRCNTLHEKRLALEKQIEKKTEEKENIRPWAGLEVPLSSITSFNHVEAVLGRVPADQADEFKSNCRDAVPSAVCNTVYSDEESAYVYIICHRQDSDRVQKFLPDMPFESISLPEEDRTARDLFRSHAEAVNSLQKEKLETESRLKEIADSLTKIKAVYDHSCTAYESLAAGRYCGNTASVFRLRGWVPSDTAGRVLHDLEEIGPVQTDVYDPSDDTLIPPVLLKNKKGIKPFELVTELYGLPSYRGVDPTAFLAPFFFLFFGLCLSDGAYGLILMACAALYIKKIKPKGNLSNLLFLCGIGTVIGGAVTGSWFGVNVSRLPEGHWASFLAVCALFDPIGTDPEPFFGLMLEGTMAFFYLSIFLGYIQICFGTFLSLKENLRKREYVEGIFNDGAWLMLYAGLLMLACSAESVPGLASYGWTGIRVPSVYILIGGLTVRLVMYPFFKAVSEKRRTSLLRVAGLYALSIVQMLDKSKDLLGNTLSYCRLMALGMATGIVGTVVNQLAVQSKAIPYVGIGVLVIILFGGHLFNLLINLLGAFVHTARLQYVEFFPYFFQGGGFPFKPFTVQYKYTRIE